MILSIEFKIVRSNCSSINEIIFTKQHASQHVLHYSDRLGMHDRFFVSIIFDRCSKNSCCEFIFRRYANILFFFFFLVPWFFSFAEIVYKYKTGSYRDRTECMTKYVANWVSIEVFKKFLNPRISFNLKDGALSLF